jgi:chemosensory pili system protein ChpA (sensor histidine kinase/response regulator)
MQAATDLDLATNDLGPLAWVLDELRKSLDSASAALRRFVRDTALARGSDMASVDGGHLRIARQQLHQAVGALEMVGLPAPAHMLRCMEAAVQKFVERPELCNEQAAGRVERAGFALTDYLEGILLGKAAPAVALFPQYREVQELAGADRIHPADLWALEWRWNDPKTPAAGEVLAYGPAVRSRLDQAVLRVMKSGDAQAAHDLAKLSLSLAASQSARQPQIFWKICAGYFEAINLGLLPLDIYVKRAGSRVLLQYASLAKGEQGVSDRLAQDLVFFCSQAVPARNSDGLSLQAVRLAWGLKRFPPVDYQTPQYGRFDPVLLSQARKRIVVAKETWSGVSGGDAGKLKNLAEQFHLVSDSLTKLHPASGPLAQALATVAESIVRAGRPPGPELAMEVATAVLYLEAAFQDLDPADKQLAQRTARLAERLDKVRQGGAPEPLEIWMEELYRRVSDRQTMGSVVGELRTTMAELEKKLDQFFRDPKDKAPLRDAPGHLSQMRGVLSVLGLDQAAQAVLRMRECVEEIIVTEIDEEHPRGAGTFEKLGNNLGALGFLIDMLSYQPALAKKLFVYDDSNGELRPLMGRAEHGAVEEPAEEPGEASHPLSEQVQAVVSQAEPSGSPLDLTASLNVLAVHAALADQPAIAQSAREAAAAVSAHDSGATAAALSSLAAAVQPATVKPVEPAAPADIEEDDLRDIFLEEAREVIQNGLAAINALVAEPAELSELTILRRAFHTLKGSSRMVGLAEFGEAAWSLEQVLNTWLADQKPANEELRSLAGEAMTGFARWAEDIAAGDDSAWKSDMFRGPADTFRTGHRLVPLVLPGAQPPEPVPAAVETAPIEFAVAAELPSIDEVSLESLPAELPELSLLPAEALPPSAPPPAEALPPLPQPAPADSGSAQAIEIVEIPAADLPIEFDFEIEPAGREAVAAATPPTNLTPDIEEIELDSLAGAQDTLPAPLEDSDDLLTQPAPLAEAGREAFTPPPEDDFVIDLGEFEKAWPEATPPAVQAIPAQAPILRLAEPQEEPPEPDDSFDEPVKVIGSLRIGIPLYNVYLNEADEWSRRLSTEVAEWSLELNRPLPDSAPGLAHALAGSSATVGFNTLSDIARALESTMRHTQSLAYGTPQHGKVFGEAAEEIRRLLHQFAAGFLKEPDTRLIERLQALKQIDIPQRDDLREDDPFSDFAELELKAPAEPPSLPPQVVEPAPGFARIADPAPARRPSAAAAAGAASAPLLPASRGPAEAGDAQDDIDLVDAIDPDLFPIFEDEAAELMPRLGGALRQWTARPDNGSAREEVLRALHTIKGSARLAGALRLGELAHRMESQIESLGSEVQAVADLEDLLQRFDGMQANWDALRAYADAAAAAAAEGGSAPLTEVAEGGTAVAEDSPRSESQPSPGAEPAPQRALLARPVVTNLAPQRASANQAVRVRSQLLDRLVNQAGEVMITRSRLEAELGQLRSSLVDLTGNLDRLRAQLRDIELQAESQMQSRLAQAKDSAAGFDPLEFDRFTRVQELTRMMAESVNDVATVQRNLQRTVESTEDDLIAQARQTRELQRDLLRTRMVEFESIADRLYRVVRLASKESGKQVKLDITGGSIEMDRGVLDRMTPAFEHLLRNCVGHGIEAPAARTAAGKDPTGTILIGLQHEGNDVSVEFHDDGAGLDVSRIREKALQRGLITAGQELSDQEAANLIFLPGFSTAEQVTELSGRGIGMDVVRSEVAALGGRVETTTVSGQGTNFKMVLPLTTAVTQVVMVRSGNLSIGVPANLVELVRRASAKEVQQAYNTGLYEFSGEQVPFYWSGALLQSSQRSQEQQAKTLPVVVFRSAAQRVVMHVDEVLGNQEVVVKNLGPQLARLPGLAGMTVLASGAVVLIYNPVALTNVYGEQARQLSADRAQPEILERSGLGRLAGEGAAAAPQIPLILVVDDSITVRRVTQRLLQREGYRVSMAADGLQALERLAEEKPTVVLSDIEMPRMDGFDLARNIRGDARTAKLPIIMITSRIAEKHRDHAMELGVDHYLGKPYSEEELLSLVKHYSAAAIGV